MKLAAKERKVQLIVNPLLVAALHVQLVNSHRAPEWGELASGDGKKRC